MIVIDASAVVEAITPDSGSGPWLHRRISSAPMVHVPALFDLEVLQAIRGLETGGILEPIVMEQALGDLAELRAVRHGHEHLGSRIWSLRHKLTAYDAAYVALAELLAVPLITADRALARSASKLVEIETPPG